LLYAPDTAEELTALPQTPSWIQEDILRREGTKGKELRGGNSIGPSIWSPHFVLRIYAPENADRTWGVPTLPVAGNGPGCTK